MHVRQCGCLVGALDRMMQRIAGIAWCQAKCDMKNDHLSTKMARDKLIEIGFGHTAQLPQSNGLTILQRCYPCRQMPHLAAQPTCTSDTLLPPM
jgi:hypothetical protein